MPFDLTQLPGVLQELADRDLFEVVRTPKYAAVVRPCDTVVEKIARPRETRRSLTAWSIERACELVKRLAERHPRWRAEHVLAVVDQAAVNVEAGFDLPEEQAERLEAGLEPHAAWERWGSVLGQWRDQDHWVRLLRQSGDDFTDVVDKTPMAEFLLMQLSKLEVIAKDEVKRTVNRYGDVEFAGVSGSVSVSGRLPNTLVLEIPRYDDELVRSNTYRLECLVEMQTRKGELPAIRLVPVNLKAVQRAAEEDVVEAVESALGGAYTVVRGSVDRDLVEQDHGSEVAARLEAAFATMLRSRREPAEPAPAPAAEPSEE